MSAKESMGHYHAFRSTRRGSCYFLSWHRATHTEIESRRWRALAGTVVYLNTLPDRVRRKYDRPATDTSAALDLIRAAMPACALASTPCGGAATEPTPSTSEEKN